jgi:hypothetical protein
MTWDDLKDAIRGRSEVWAQEFIREHPPDFPVADTAALIRALQHEECPAEQPAEKSLTREELTAALRKGEDEGVFNFEWALDFIRAHCPEFPVDERDAFVRKLRDDWDAEYLPEKAPPIGKTRTKGGATILMDFRALPPDDEVWYACRAPFSSYAVSSYAHVARLVGKPGAQARSGCGGASRVRASARSGAGLWRCCDYVLLLAGRK